MSARADAAGASPPVASVVIPCHNAAPWIGEQLDALARQTFTGAFEVLVVDNGSTDDSAAIARRYTARLLGLRVLDAVQRRGASYARNTGVAAARGRFILFCDADDVVADTWLDAMVRALEQNPFVGCRVDHARLNPEWAQASRHYAQADGLQPVGLTLPGVAGTVGSGTMGIRRDVFLAVGGFDESIRTNEDHEFCWRVQIAGTPLAFAPEPVLHYRFRTDYRGVLRQGYRYGYDFMRLVHRYRSLGHSYPLKTWRGFGLECVRQLGRLPRALGNKAALTTWLYDFGNNAGVCIADLRKAR